MLKYLLSSLLICLTLTISIGQNTLKGKVIESQSLLPIQGMTISIIDGNNTISDESGMFVIELRGPMSDVSLDFLLDDFHDVLDFELSENAGSVDLGTISLNYTTAIDADFIPTIILDEGVDDVGRNENISGMLSASRDIFTSTAAFVFGPARFRIRGYDSENNAISLNHIPMNDLEVGRASFSSFGGLNDVMRNQESQIGLAAIPHTIGGIGGASETDLRASNQRRQKKLTYSLTNRSYSNRVMGVYSTGLMPSNWAISVLASRRWAKEGYVPGTFYDATSYFISIDRKFSDKNSLNLVFFGAPNKRGRNAAATKEMYEIAGTNYYNSYWGYQNGEKRNSRVGDTHIPIGILRHDLKISDVTTLTTAVSFQTGKSGSSALDWYRASDPRPDYYRRLPSAIADPALAAQVYEIMQSDENQRQLQWDEMYEANRNSMATIKNVDGIEGNDRTGRLAHYILEDRRYDPTIANFTTSIQHEFDEQFSFQGGVQYRWQKNENYRLVKDLLGAEFYVDYDKFAERDFIGNNDIIQNDLNNPNRILQVGDRFGYDYDANIRQAKFWAQLNYTSRKIDAFIAGEGSQTNFWRTGHYRNGKFPEDSFGDSKKFDYSNRAGKAGVTFKIDGRNYLYVNAMALTRAPFFRNAFVSPRTRNQGVRGLKSEKIESIEVGYNLRSPYLKARLTGYYTNFRDQSLTRSFYHDDERSFVNFSMTGIDKRHTGIEAAAEYTITPGFTIHGVAAVGQYIYNSRPTATVSQDNTAELLSEDLTIYAKNFYVAGTPQTAYTAGLSYQSKHYWSLYVNVNYFSNVWLDFNPIRRTVDAVDLVDSESTLWRQIIDQEQAEDAMTINVSFYKSFVLNWFKERTFLGINLSVTNALDNQDFSTGGYEQLRFDFEGKDVDRFPTRYYYFQGLNYFVNVSLRF